MTIMNMVGGGTDDKWAEGTPLIPNSSSVSQLKGFTYLKVSTSTRPVVFSKKEVYPSLQGDFSTPGARYMDTSHNTYAYSLFNSDIGKYLNVVSNNDGECLSNITTINPTAREMAVTTWNINPKNMSGVALDSINGVTVEGAQLLDGEYTFEGVWVIAYGDLTPTYCSGDYRRTSGRLTAVNGVITMVTFDQRWSENYYTSDSQIVESMTYACHVFTRLNKQ